jgi:hypothetical protein
MALHDSNSPKCPWRPEQEYPLLDQEASPGMKKKSSHASTTQATQKQQNRFRPKKTQKPPLAITRVKSLHVEGSVETVKGNDEEEIERRKHRK